MTGGAVAGPLQPGIYRTLVHHARTAPLRNTFTYRSYWWLVDLDNLPRLPWHLRPLARFLPRDHFNGDAPTLRAAVDGYLAAHGVDLPGGRVYMLASARVLGYVFNPISVYWCFDAAGVQRAVVAEVHNTYGQRHCYLLRPDSDGRARVAKAFYVSPFNAVDGEYTMRVPAPGPTLALAVTLHRPGQPPFVTTVRGRWHPPTARALLAAARALPLAPLRAAAQIRWQGVRLWLRRLPVQPRPATHPAIPSTPVQPRGACAPVPPTMEENPR